MKLKEICDALKLPYLNDIELTGVSIDSRQVKPGNLFVAIKGENFDGQQFIFDAVTKGAAAVVCKALTPNIDVPQLVVSDTIKALAEIAKAYRQHLTCKVIALTGSNGKTTTKEMIAAILPKPSYATLGNLNNHIGVPLSVLQLQATHQYAVFELGASHIGEIAHTVAVAQPHVALITNIAPAHIEGFGSIEGVARAKGEIYQGLGKNGIAIVNDDDDFSHFWDTVLSDKKVIRFSTTKLADVYAKDIHFDALGCAKFTLVISQKGEIPIQLNVPGAHNVGNAVAAAGCVHALGIELSDIALGLHAFQGVKGRMTFREGKNHSLVIDDTYNANLRSTLTAIEVLAKREGRRIFVFGDMAELGCWTKQHHEEIGTAARQSGIDILMTYGTHSKSAAEAYGETSKHYQQREELIHALLEQLDENTTVLVKGSRSSAMEKIVDQIIV